MKKINVTAMRRDNLGYVLTVEGVERYLKIINGAMKTDALPCDRCGKGARAKVNLFADADLCLCSICIANVAKQIPLSLILFPRDDKEVKK